MRAFITKTLALVAAVISITPTRPALALTGDGILISDGYLMGDSTTAAQSRMVQRDPGAPAK